MKTKLFNVARIPCHIAGTGAVVKKHLVVSGCIHKSSLNRLVDLIRNFELSFFKPILLGTLWLKKDL